MLTPSQARPAHSSWQVLRREVRQINGQLVATGTGAARQVRDLAASCTPRSWGWRPAKNTTVRDPAGPSLWAVRRRVWQSEDYRRQFWGRMGTQCAQGVYYGASVLLLNTYGGALRYSGSQLADNLIRTAEMFSYQFGMMRRARVEDAGRSTTAAPDRSADAAGPAAARPALPLRYQLAAALLYSWVGEAALAGCFLGIVLSRKAAWLTTRRMLLALGTARVARVLLVQTQYAALDGFKSQVEPSEVRADIKRYWAGLRAIETTSGMVVNSCTGLAMQYLPLLVPQPAILGLLIGLTLVSVGLSLASKLPFRRYLHEGIEPQPGPWDVHEASPSTSTTKMLGNATACLAVGHAQ